MTKRLLFFLVTLLMSFTMVFGQTSGKISGVVKDSKTGDPLVQANVVVTGTSMGAFSDENGRFVILDVPVGDYTLRCEYIGYSPMVVEQLAVFGGLTTFQDFGLQVEAVAGEVVTVIAERPIINMNATNTTRIIDNEILENMAVRGVENVVALQTGVVAHDGEIFVRGSRAEDVAYYVDGVYMNDAFDMTNTSTVSNATMEEMQLQTGGFSAQYGNANGGIVNTTTRTGGDNMNINIEYVRGLGAADDGTEDQLYSYGYQLYNVNIGGPVGSRIKYFLSYENRHTDDADPTQQAHFAMDRTAMDVDWTKLTPTTDANNVTTYSGELWIDGANVGTITDVLDATLGTEIENQAAAFYGDQYDVVDAAKTAATNETGEWAVNGYNNFQKLYGPKKNVASDRNTLTGNLQFDLKPFKIKMGGSYNAIESHSYIHAYSLLNSENNRRNETLQKSFYTNLTWALSSTSYLKAKFSLFQYEETFADDYHWDQIATYGTPDDDRNAYLSGVGLNPLSIQPLANFSSYGSVWDDYSYQSSAYMGISADYLNQIGNHELTTGFEYRDNTIKYYRVGQPVELAKSLDDATNVQMADEDWKYIVYRNAYTENLGFDLYGEENESGNSYQDPGQPVVLGAYINDKIELKDMVLNVGVRYEYFDPNTEAPSDWNNISMTDGRIDRDASDYQPVDADVQINPRIGFSFPVTDKTKFHAQYGKFSQHPILNRLYLSDVVFAANFTSGNYTRSPNAALKPEKTTQYEVGFAQSVGENVALDVTGFYKEIRDYTLITNLFDANLDGAEFVWAQYQNGDYGVTKGVSVGLNMRRTQGLMANLSYTMSWAAGTGSDPESNYYIAWQSDAGSTGYPTIINPLEHDQRHTGNLLIDYRFDKKAGFLLANSGINLLYTFGSGTAYTPSKVESALYGRGEIYPTAAINTAYKPWTSNMDVRVDKRFNLGSMSLTAYLLVQNAMNTVNTNVVYDGTGEAGTDGWLYTDPGKAWLSGNPDAETYYMAQIQDPRNWDTPRLVQLGLKVDL